VSTWVAVLAVGGGSYLARLLPLLVRRAAETGPRVQRRLGYAGVAAITALVAAALRHHTDATGWADGVAALVATGIATVLSRQGRSFLLAVGVALVAYLALARVLGAV
jgi:branched-subunit amino acid transport protein